MRSDAIASEIAPASRLFQPFHAKISLKCLLQFITAKANILDFLEFTLSIELVGSLVLSIDFPEQTFQFLDLFIPYIFPDDKHRKMRPVFCCTASVSVEPGSKSASRRSHADVNHVEFLHAGAFLMQGVNTSDTLWY